MPNAQEPKDSGRKAAKHTKKTNSPLSPGFDKKLDGPNRPST